MTDTHTGSFLVWAKTTISMNLIIKFFILTIKNIIIIIIIQANTTAVVQLPHPPIIINFYVAKNILLHFVQRLHAHKWTHKHTKWLQYRIPATTLQWCHYSRLVSSSLHTIIISKPWLINEGAHYQWTTLNWYRQLVQLHETNDDFL